MKYDFKITDAMIEAGARVLTSKLYPSCMDSKEFWPDFREIAEDVLTAALSQQENTRAEQPSEYKRGLLRAAEILDEIHRDMCRDNPTCAYFAEDFAKDIRQEAESHEV